MKLIKDSLAWLMNITSSISNSPAYTILQYFLHLSSLSFWLCYNQILHISLDKTPACHNCTHPVKLIIKIVSPSQWTQFHQYQILIYTIVTSQSTHHLSSTRFRFYYNQSLFISLDKHPTYFNCTYLMKLIIKIVSPS